MPPADASPAPAGEAFPAVAFVGLGRMGWPMAGHLVAAGHRLIACDADAQRQQRFVGEVGGAPLHDPSDLSSVAAVVLMLPTSAIVRDALLGAGDLAAGLAPGTVVIDMSSSVPRDTRELAAELAARGHSVVDAPVSGGVARATDGTLTIMLGSDDEAAAQLAERVVAPLSRQVFRTGGVGTGHAMKALNNFLAASAFVATSQAIIAGREFGLAPEVMVDVINTSTGRSFISELVMPTVLSEEFDTGFALGLLAKDVRIAQDLIADVGPRSAVCDEVEARLSDAESALGSAADHSRAFAHWSRRPTGP
ncbi:MAG TPA: NAD(P)-dependent oxidoreductase [Solirubrobacteraceae bacterium]|jgi:3-hydroxyisobutyrate dehydrogenase|nr:NAD(P)-dependent oxidoreductase [Solirubrobacteraceae bacterium]